MSGYRSTDDWPEATVDRDPGNRRLNVSWILLSLGVGIAVVFFVSRFASGGTAEIAGIIAGSLVMNLRVLWEYRVTAHDRMLPDRTSVFQPEQTSNVEPLQTFGECFTNSA